MKPYADNSRVCHTKQNKRVLNVTQITTKNSLRYMAPLNYDRNLPH